MTGTGFAYDGNGNPTSYAGSTLTFDPENRMTSFGSMTGATYRADGLRASKTTSSGTTYFLYDGAEPIVEMNSSGTVTATNVFAPDGLVARTTSAGTTEYVFDQQGNVADRTNTSGAVQSVTQYDGWGNEQAISGTPSDPFGYNAQSGYYLDRETGLYLCQHRFYDPANGRWINRDPIGYGGGTNLYGYCASGPVGWADSSGEVAFLAVAAIVGVIALGVGAVSAWTYTVALNAKTDREMGQALKDFKDYMGNHHPDNDFADCNDAPARDLTNDILHNAADAWKVGATVTYDNPFVKPSGSVTISEGPDQAIITDGEDAADKLDAFQGSAKAASDQMDELKEKIKKEREKREKEKKETIGGE